MRHPGQGDKASAAEMESQLLGWFDRADRVTVAFSGGVDSSLVLAAAVRALGAEHVHAVTAVSESLPSAMLPIARDLAASLGVRHSEIATREIENPGYSSNGPDRCYFCKATLLDTAAVLGSIETGSVLVTGTNADDVREGWRPGIRAAAERGAEAPLAEVGMGKADVRALSREWALPTWDRPASPCLSSRIAYGIHITPARLARVDAAEGAVRSILGNAGLACHDLRVRDLGQTVRLELDAAIVAAARQIRAVAEAVAAAGFGSAELEIRAFRSGSLNESLPAEMRFR
jgi:pyridinium-3,5-biscarboxylic acid mononucleotide sulfurtransferase